MTRGLLVTGGLAGGVAAIATTVLAAGTRAVAGLEIDGTEIPLAAFAWWTLVGALLGVVLARVLGRRRRFVVVAVVGTALSLVPPVVVPDDLTTRAVLVLTHLLAAGIVVPALAGRLPSR